MLSKNDLNKTLISLSQQKVNLIYKTTIVETKHNSVYHWNTSQYFPKTLPGYLFCDSPIKEPGRDSCTSMDWLFYQVTKLAPVQWVDKSLCRGQVLSKSSHFEQWTRSACSDWINNSVSQNEQSNTLLWKMKTFAYITSWKSKANQSKKLL